MPRRDTHYRSGLHSVDGGAHVHSVRVEVEGGMGPGASGGVDEAIAQVSERAACTAKSTGPRGVLSPPPPAWPSRAGVRSWAFFHRHPDARNDPPRGRLAEGHQRVAGAQHAAWGEPAHLERMMKREKPQQPANEGRGGWVEL